MRQFSGNQTLACAIVVLTLSMAVLGLPIYAQVQFAHLGVDDGMPQNMVESMYRDSRGYLWVGTYNGLGRYDGSSFENYTESDVRCGLPGNTIFKIFEDSEQNIWVGTNRGLALFDRDKDRFIQVQSLKVCITDIDQCSSGQLWVSTQQGLFLFNTARRGVIKQYGIEDGFPSDMLTCCTPDGDGNLWIGTGSRGVFSFDIVTKKVTACFQVLSEKNSISSDRIKTLAIDKRSNLWIGTMDAGISVLNLKTHKNTCISSRANDDRSLGSNQVSCIISDSRGCVWVGCQNGFLNKYDNNTGQFTRFKAEPFNPRFLQSNTVSTIAEDADGNLWCGTYESGLFCMSKQQNRFKVYANIPGKSNGLRNDNVRSIVECDGRIVVGSDGGGLQYFDPEASTFSDLGQGKFKNMHVMHVAAFNGELWCSTWGEGVCRVNLRNNKTTNYLQREGDTAGLSMNNIRVINVFRDKAWIGTSGDGLQTLDLATNTFSNHGAVTQNASDFGLPRWITSTLLDSRGRVWATSFDGMLQMSPGKHQTFVHDTSRQESLSDNIVYTVFEDSRHQLWMLTNRGLDKFVEATQTFEHLLPEDGFPAAPLAMIEDNLQVLWISATDGLYRYDEQAGQIMKYTWRDGITSGPFNIGASLAASDGSLYFGSKKGFVRIFPWEFRSPVQSPRIVLRNLFVDNVKQSPLTSPVVSRSIDVSDSLVLRYSTSVISIELVDLYNILSGNTAFEYRVEGFRDTWIPLDESRKIVLSNIPPGKYRMVVRAKHEGDACSTRVLSLVIKPRWWQTWWFFVSVGVLVLALLYLIYRASVVVIRSQNESLKTRIDEKTSDLKIANEELTRQNNELAEKEFLLQIKNDELQNSIAMKNKLFSIIAHDLKNPLTSILGFATVLHNDQNLRREERMRNRVDSLFTSTRKLYDHIDTLLNWSISQARLLSTAPVELELDVLVNENVSLFQELAASKEISIKIDFSHTSNAFADKDMIAIVFRNLLSNAIKFTRRGGAICISTLNTADATVIQVSDNGVGMSQEQIIKIYTESVSDSTAGTEYERGTGLGLAICRDFLNINNAKMEIVSKPGIGTVVSMSLPKGMAAQQQKNRSLITIDEPVTPALQNNRESSLQLLIVEDNPEIRQYLAEMFESSFIVETATDGEDGYQKALQQIPDLIITDLNMPVSGGLELCQHVQQEPLLNHIPIIIVSAHAGEENQLLGLKAGAYDFVPKPFNKGMLYLKVQSLLDSRKKFKDYLKKKFVQEPSTIFSQSAEDKFMLSMHKVLDKHYMDSEFSVEKFATEMGYSRSQLFRKLKASIDTTPVEYLKMFRLKKAKELIDTGNWRVAEIAYEVGFSDPVYFGSCFKQQYGASPNHFIKNKV